MTKAECEQAGDLIYAISPMEGTPRTVDDWTSKETALVTRYIRHLRKKRERRRG